MSNSKLFGGYGTRSVPTTLKEIKGTLSKKMAFSLMRLITIFTLAFVVPSAMAQFATILSVEDVSYAADNQIERGADKDNRAWRGHGECYGGRGKCYVR